MVKRVGTCRRQMRMRIGVGGRIGGAVEVNRRRCCHGEKGEEGTGGVVQNRVETDDGQNPTQVLEN
jgi:hypothetical protein